MGNDDWVELPPRPGWHNLHLQRREFGEFSFVGYQNTPRFMGGPNEREEGDQRCKRRSRSGAGGMPVEK
jgi:hypothetical protein